MVVDLRESAESNAARSEVLELARQHFGIAVSLEPGGALAPGSAADVVVFDPETAWTVRPEEFYSKSRNTPFHGWEVKGKAVMTIVGGEVKWEG